MIFFRFLICGLMALFLSGCPNDDETEPGCSVTGWERIYEHDWIVGLTGSAPDSLHAVYRELEDFGEGNISFEFFHYFDGQSWSETAQEIHPYVIFTLDTGTVLSVYFPFFNQKGVNLTQCNGDICELVSVVEFDNDDLIFMPTSIWASSENDIWIAGENYVTMHDDDHGPIKSSRIDYFWHYNGEKWSIKEVPGYDELCNFEGCRSASIRGIWGESQDDVWTLVYDEKAETSEILHYDGESFSLILEVEDELKLLYALEPNHVYFSSTKRLSEGMDEGYRAESKLHHFSSDALTPMPFPDDEDIESYIEVSQGQMMWGFSPSSLFLWYRKVWHYDGQEWSRFDTPHNEHTSTWSESTQIFTLAPNHLYSVEKDGVYKATCESE